MDDFSTSPVSPTKEKSKEIKAINKETVHRICSGQVVLSLAIAIKELVENSLDAGATAVEIRLQEYGSELIEVSDNGSGVQEENLEALTLKHHTSKLQEFSDLVGVETFGFRGEALSSLCALSELTVTTRHASSVTGTKLTYDSNGHIKSKMPCARQIGTSITLANLFSPLPVRQKEFLRNVKREFVKMTHLLYGYCLIASHAKISCVNITKKGSRTIVVSTQGNGSVKDNIASIFGSKQVNGLLEIKGKPSKKYLEDLGITTDISDLFRLEGWISSCAHGLGRSAADRQFFYINNRPCEPTKVSKVINEVYHQFNVHQYPFVFLSITTDRSGVDVNVTPDKRLIFLENEKLLLAAIKATLLQLYENIPSTFLLQNVNPTLPKPTRNEEMVVTSQSPSSVSLDVCKAGSLAALRKNFSHDGPKSPTKESSLANGRSKVEPLGRGTKRVIEVDKDRDGKKQMSLASFIKSSSSPKKECSSPILSVEKTGLEPDQENTVEQRQTNPEIYINSVATNDTAPAEIESVNSSDTTEPPSQNLDSSQSVTITIEGDALPSSCNSEVLRSSQSNSVDGGNKLNSQTNKTELDEVEMTIDSLEEIGEEKSDLMEVENSTEEIEILTRTNCKNGLEEERERNMMIHEVICDEDDGSVGKGRKAVSLEVDINEIRRKFQSRKSKLSKTTGDKSKPIVKFYAEIDPNSNKTAEQELRKEISKSMFAQMAIIGQFNLGFIITLLGNDLFIVDQHATDEKYNFETLERTTVIQNQKLVIPQTLELTSVNEGLLLDNIEVFRKNGFDFIFDENGAPTRRVQLTAKPYSQNWEFGREDIDELLFMLSDAPHTMCRPSRVRAMFASRACRKSVMIGTALSKSDMRRLINHMGEIEQPWNCPHGRPTMRHLINLEMVRKK